MAGTINVLCAPPNGRNTGMASVDMAGASVLSELDARVRYWRLWDQSEWADPPGISRPREGGGFFDPDTGLEYQLARGRLDEFLDADAVVYWGDFLHMAVYHRDATDVLHRRVRAYGDAGTAARAVAEHLLLRGRTGHDVGHVLSYGSTLSMNTPTDYAGAYGDDLAGFLGSVGGVWLRDGYSAQTARLHRNGSSASCQGLDAAFLLGERDRRARDGSVAVFFGRSALRPELVADFGARLATRTGLRPRLLAWGEEPAFWPMAVRRRFRAAWPGLEHETARPGIAQRRRTWRGVVRGDGVVPSPPSPAALFEQIADSSLVLTDTYHLAVNAWRLGTPAVVVTDRPTSTWSVNSGEPDSARDKRHDLYSQLDALGLLVDPSSLGPGASREADRVRDRLRDESSNEVTHQRVAALKEASRREVVSVLGDRMPGTG